MPAGVCGEAAGPVSMNNISSNTHKAAPGMSGVRRVILGIFNGVIL